MNTKKYTPITKRSKKIVFLILFIVFATFFLVSVSENNILLYDANTYYQNALLIYEKNSYFQDLFSLTSTRFVDIGYPLFLAFLMRLAGQSNFLFFQIINYILLVLSGVLIGKSVSFVIGREKIENYLLIVSPLFLSFAPKLYSEIYSIFGISLIIFGLTTFEYSPSIKGSCISIGTLVIVTTKSFFAPYIFMLAVFLFIKNKKAFVGISIGILLSIFSLYSSFFGGRSNYNILIQTAKINQSNDTIFACSFYNLSFPIGKKIFPQYEGACYQNAPTPNMPKYAENPYLESNKNKAGILLILKHPLKFLFVSLSSLMSIVLFEGIYGDVIVTYPPIIQITLWIVFKLTLSIFMWFRFISITKEIFRTNVYKSILLISPLIYFCVVVIMFPVEQRYFYPIIPFLYFYLLTGTKLCRKTQLFCKAT